jgi:hypothetical protein
MGISRWPYRRSGSFGQVCAEQSSGSKGSQSSGVSCDDPSFVQSPDIGENQHSRPSDELGRPCVSCSGIHKEYRTFIVSPQHEITSTYTLSGKAATCIGAKDPPGCPQSNDRSHGSFLHQDSLACPEDHTALSLNCDNLRHNVHTCCFETFPDAACTRHQHSRRHSMILLGHLPARSTGGCISDPQATAHLSWDDRLRFLLSAPADTDLAHDREFIASVESQATSGYLESLAEEATACLDDCLPPQ